jgi:hypothetical protein
MIEARDFLDKLVGRWELTGQMGEIPLQQSVEARWTLGGLFVEMYFRSTLAAQEGRLPYEAVYYIGYHEGNEVYVMHLLDTFGVGVACIVGVGKREGDRIPFVFEYEGGPFTNTFIWQGAAGSWSFEQSFLKDGQRQTFANERMVRVGA